MILQTWLIERFWWNFFFYNSKLKDFLDVARLIYSLPVIFPCDTTFQVFILSEKNIFIFLIQYFELLVWKEFIMWKCNINSNVAKYCKKFVIRFSMLSNFIITDIQFLGFHRKKNSVLIFLTAEQFLRLFVMIIPWYKIP